jgi:hypothetical protein
MRVAGDGNAGLKPDAERPRAGSWKLKADIGKSKDLRIAIGTKSHEL